VLDRAAGVDVLQLGEESGLDVCADRVEPNDRRVADELEDGGIFPGHLRKAYFADGSRTSRRMGPARFTQGSSASRSVTLLVPEVAASGEHHRRAGCPNGLGDLVIALRAAGLDDPRHTGIERGLRAVGKGKERIG